MSTDYNLIDINIKDIINFRLPMVIKTTFNYSSTLDKYINNKGEDKTTIIEISTEDDREFFNRLRIALVRYPYNKNNLSDEQIRYNSMVNFLIKKQEIHDKWGIPKFILEEEEEDSYELYAVHIIDTLNKLKNENIVSSINKTMINFEEYIKKLQLSDVDKQQFNNLINNLIKNINNEEIVIEKVKEITSLLITYENQKKSNKTNREIMQDIANGNISTTEDYINFLINVKKNYRDNIYKEINDNLQLLISFIIKLKKEYPIKSPISNIARQINLFNTNLKNFDKNFIILTFDENFDKDFDENYDDDFEDEEDIDKKEIGGKSQKLKKTNNKIKVLYKKKEYMRVIFVNKNNKKFVKINKQILELSKLKKI